MIRTANGHLFINLKLMHEAVGWIGFSNHVFKALLNFSMYCGSESEQLKWKLFH